jgi:hypothetical protein
MPVPAIASFLWMMLSAQGSVSLPWVYPGDFRDRLRMSDLVISGTIDRTSVAGVRKEDGIEVTANIATVRIDRVFLGNAGQERLSFSWFTPHSTRGMGFVYSGPPVAQFRPGARCLIFLRRTAAGWEVAMPVYAIDVELAAQARGTLRDLSRAPAERLYMELAEELENAAMALPAPPPGETGKAVLYFSPVFDVVGACAQPFYRRFLSSPSPELRQEASKWLELIRSRRLECKGLPVPLFK